MRGKVTTMLANIDTVRITPAYAGKSHCSVVVNNSNKDHPRLCGEKILIPKISNRRIGITPAYAGKSGKSLLCTTGFEDHPRLCGEKWKEFTLHHRI